MCFNFLFVVMFCFVAALSARAAERFSAIPQGVWRLMARDDVYRSIPGLEEHGQTEVKARVASLQAHCRSVSYLRSRRLASLRFNGPEHELIFVVRQTGKQFKMISKLVESPTTYSAYLSDDKRDGVQLHVGSDSDGHLPGRPDTNVESMDVGLEGERISDPRSDAQRELDRRAGVATEIKPSNEVYRNVSTGEEGVNDAPDTDSAETTRIFNCVGGRFILAQTETVDIAPEEVPADMWRLLAADEVFKEMDGGLESKDGNAMDAKGETRIALLKEKGRNTSIVEFPGVNGAFYLFNYSSAKNGVFFDSTPRWPLRVGACRTRKRAGTRVLGGGGRLLLETRQSFANAGDEQRR